MADDQYHPLYQEAVNLQYKFHDFTAGSTHPEVRILQNEIHQLVEDIEVKKNPRTIEDRIKTIQRQLDQTQHQADPAIHFQNHSYMHDNFEQMRQQMQHFDNY